MDFNYDGETNLAGEVMNILIVKERLVFVLYYDNFKDAQYLAETKAADYYFVIKMIVKNWLQMNTIEPWKDLSSFTFR